MYVLIESIRYLIKVSSLIILIEIKTDLMNSSLWMQNRPTNRLKPQHSEHYSYRPVAVVPIQKSQKTLIIT